MSLPAYGEYKGSEVEWLGRVPSHWGVDRIKASIALARNGIWGDEPQGDENDIACVRVADFDRGKLQVKPIVPTVRSVTEKERVGRALNKGDLLLEKSGGGEFQPVGQVVLYQLDAPAVCSNFVARVVLKPGMCAGYWNYVHSAAYVVGINVGSINQTSGIQNLDQDRYFNERAPFPPEEEQVAITAFLDRETGKIDALIADQERLISLLAEKRQDTIFHAVTRGLNPNAPMKDSGVAWLGAVPAHWLSKRLKHISPFITVGIVVNPSDYVAEEGLPFIYGGDIAEGRISTETARRITTEASCRHEKTRLYPGDLLTVRVGAPGVTAVVPENCAGGNCASVMLTRRGDFDSNWLCFAMNSRMVRCQVEAVQYGAAQEQFNISHAINFWVMFPPKSEQTEIAEFLASEVSKLADLSRAAEGAIALLRARRSALIVATVTGKFDVRGSVAEIENIREARFE